MRKFVSPSADVNYPVAKSTAQAYHNLCPANLDLLDPSLTPLGEEQCHNLSREFPYHASVEALVTSPLRRAIYTTLLAFQPGISRGLPVIALPEAQELGTCPWT